MQASFPTHAQPLFHGHHRPTAGEFNTAPLAAAASEPSTGDCTAIAHSLSTCDLELLAELIHRPIIGFNFNRPFINLWTLQALFNHLYFSQHLNTQAHSSAFLQALIQQSNEPGQLFLRPLLALIELVHSPQAVESSKAVFPFLSSYELATRLRHQIFCQNPQGLFFANIPHRLFHLLNHIYACERHMLYSLETLGNIFKERCHFEPPHQEIAAILYGFICALTYQHQRQSTQGIVASPLQSPPGHSSPSFQSYCVPPAPLALSMNVHPARSALPASPCAQQQTDAEMLIARWEGAMATAPADLSLDVHSPLRAPLTAISPDEDVFKNPHQAFRSPVREPIAPSPGYTPSPIGSGSPSYTRASVDLAAKKDNAPQLVICSSPSGLP